MYTEKPGIRLTQTWMTRYIVFSASKSRE